MSVFYEGVDITNQKLLIKAIENDPIIFKFIKTTLRRRRCVKVFFFSFFEEVQLL